MSSNELSLPTDGLSASQNRRRHTQGEAAGSYQFADFSLLAFRDPRIKLVCT